MEDIQTNSQGAAMSEVNNSVPTMPVSNRSPRMAGFLERFAALLIDGLIIFIASFPIQFGIGFLTGIGNAAAGSDNVMATFNSAWGFGSLIGIAIQFGYFGWFDVNKGQTLGKQLMKIKVVRSADLKYVTWGEAFLREILGRIASGILFNLGYLWYFMSPKRQTWHDSIASTYVVKTDDSGNILMDGLDNYAKEPIKTFGCCALMGIILAGVMAMIIYAIAVIGSEITEGMKNGSLNQKYDYDTDIEMQNDFNMENGEDVQQFESEEEMRRYFEENFPEEMNQLDQQMESIPDNSGQPL